MTDPSDALRDLANAMDDEAPTPPAKSTRPDAPASSRPESPIAQHPPAPTNTRPEAPPTVSEPDPAMASASALAELSGATDIPYDPGPARRTTRQPNRRKPDTSMMQFRSAAVPVLITVGLIMLALGFWGLLILMGNTSLPLADQPDSKQYAILGIICLPVGLCLLAGAGFFFYQIGLDKKKIAAYEQAIKAQKQR